MRFVREKRFTLRWWGDGTTNVKEPTKRVELGVHSLDLPSLSRAVKVTRNKAIDALNREELLTNVSGPPESNVSAVDRIDVEHREADSGLRTLALHKGGFVGEGWATNWVASELVDAV